MTIDKEFESFLFSQDDGEMYSSAYRRAWQAARAIDAKRIAELEAWANRPVTDNTQLIANMEAQITDLEAQNKVMREALEKLRDCDFVISLPDRMDSVRDIARISLAKVEG